MKVVLVGPGPDDDDGDEDNGGETAGPFF